MRGNQSASYSTLISCRISGFDLKGIWKTNSIPQNSLEQDFDKFVCFGGLKSLNKVISGAKDLSQPVSHIS